MDINLQLTAIKWILAAHLEYSAPSGEAFIVKNLEACTYLTVTPTQWQLFHQVAEPHSVPKCSRPVSRTACAPLWVSFTN